MNKFALYLNFTTMNRNLRLFWSVLLLFLNGLLSLSHAVLAQTITIIPNPDNGGGYTDRFNSESFEPLVEMDNILYGRYVDADGNGRLVKFDGTSLILIPNPDNSHGVFGNMIAHNHAIYAQYSSGVGRLVKYDGHNLTLINNPDSGLGFFGGTVLTIFNNILYGRYLDVNNIFHLVRIDNNTVNLPLSISSIENTNCNQIGENKFSFSFTPKYTGSTGQPITFSVINEMEPTTSPGPYKLSLYRDNPVITLRATQAGSSGEARYEVNWYRYCVAGARLATEEPVKGLNVIVLPNPSSGQTVEVIVQGVSNQLLDLQVNNEQGVLVSHLRIEKAIENEHDIIRLGSSSGIYFLKVNTPNQTKTVKIIKR